MRCYSCHKEFNYEKYYGICPKCGCFNQQKSQQERHEELHDRFGDDSDHRKDEGCVYVQEQRKQKAQSAYVYASARERGQKKKGKGLFVFSVCFFIVSFLVCAAAFLVKGMTAESVLEVETGADVEEQEGLLIQSHELGDSFEFQEGMKLRVMELRLLADRQTLPNLPEGRKLVAVRISGQGDGAYEDYNKIKEPILETSEGFWEAVPDYNFEPYGQMLGAFPVLDSYALMGEESCDGWVAFLVDEEALWAQVWLDSYDWTDYDGGTLLESHCVAVTIEGGETDEQ